MISYQSSKSFQVVWDDMKKLVSTVEEFKTIGKRTTFKTRLVGSYIEVDSNSAKSLQKITKESAKENYDIFISLPKHERYNTSHYKATWNKVYVLRLFKEIFGE